MACQGFQASVKERLNNEEAEEAAPAVSEVWANSCSSEGALTNFLCTERAPVQATRAADHSVQSPRPPLMRVLLRVLFCCLPFPVCFEMDFHYFFLSVFVFVARRCSLALFICFINPY